MHFVKVTNLNQPNLSPVTASYCVSFFCRLRGLTFRRNMTPDRGLLLVQGRDSRLDSGIHMLGVFFDIAVVWISSSYEVVDTRLARAWRPVYIPIRAARYVLEIHPSRLNDFHIGDEIRFEKV